MNFIEVRSGGQVLILARPGVLPSATRKASDRQRLPGVLARLPQDKPGMAMLRAGWSSIFPTGNITYLTDTQIATQVSEGLRARRIEAALLRDPSVPLTPAELQDMQHAFANATVRRGQIVIGGRGTLPAAATGAINPSLVIQMLGIMQDGEESAVTLDRQASRLSAFGLGSLRGPALRQGIIAKINQRVLDAAYIPPGPAATAAANHSSAGVPVDKMSMADKVGAALERSLPHLSGEIRALVAEMVTPTNLVIMAGVFVAVALANTNPVTGAAVDTILIGLAWFTAGLAGIRALGDFIDATIDAVRAQTQAELDAAGQTYARALVGLGSALIQAIMARFLSRRGGTSEEAGGPSAAGGDKAPPAPRAPSPPPKPPTVESSPAQLPLDSKSKIEAVLAAKNADQPVPPPSSYLSKEYIDHHLAEFKDGSVYKVIGGPPRDGPFGGDSVFVLPKSEIDAALLKSGGDPRKLEGLLGMDKGYLGDTPYLLEFPNPKNLGMATGNEANAWKGLWEPGGFTKGGIKEAVIDGKIDPADIVASPIRKGP